VSRGSRQREQTVFHDIGSADILDHDKRQKGEKRRVATRILRLITEKESILEKAVRHVAEAETLSPGNWSGSKNSKHLAIQRLMHVNLLRCFSIRIIDCYNFEAFQFLKITVSSQDSEVRR
jgi:hypothetical protein